VALDAVTPLSFALTDLPKSLLKTVPSRPNQNVFS